LPREEEKSQNPVHMKMKNLSLVLIPVLTYFSALLTSQVVSPPPDGGYPGSNTAEGQNALLNLTSGTNNTAFGWFSISSNTSALQYGRRRWDAFCQHRRRQHGNRRRGVLNNTTGANNAATGVFAPF